VIKSGPRFSSGGPIPGFWKFDISPGKIDENRKYWCEAYDQRQEGNPFMAVNVNQLFQTMVRTGISDIHFKAGTPPMVRVNGRMISSEFNKMMGEHIEELANVLMNDEQKSIFAKQRELDMAYSVPNLSRFRVNVYRQRGTVALTLRVLPLKVRNFDDLNLPTETLKKLCANTRGLILVSGITGSGKTTTLNAMIDYINNNYAYNIITVEDPIEYFHNDAKASIAQREVGSDTESFGKALKHILRQDPDVVVLGEVRDDETIKSCIVAAETGHLVLATIHTMNAAQTMDRLLEAYGGSELQSARVRISNVLKGIVAQRLLESVDGNMRFPASEILMVTSLLRKHIVEGKTSDIAKAIEQGQFYGMRSFDQDIVRLFKENKITMDEAMDAATNPDDLTLKLKGVGSA
jgi:twitching motility protein PilT